METTLNKITIFLNTTSATLHTFNMTLNKIIATATFSPLHPRKTTNHATKQILNLTTSDHIPKQCQIITTRLANVNVSLNNFFERSQTAKMLLSNSSQNNTLPLHPAKPHSIFTFQKINIYDSTDEHCPKLFVCRFKIANASQKYNEPPSTQTTSPIALRKNNYFPTALFSLFTKKPKYIPKYTPCDPKPLHTMPPSPTNLPPLSQEDSPPTKLLSLSSKKTPSSIKKNTRKKLNMKTSSSFKKQTLQPKPAPHLTTPDTSPTLTETIASGTDNSEKTPSPSKKYATNFQEALSSIPMSITHSSDQLYILCQLRRGKDQLINNHLAALHNDESILSFLPTLIETAFHPHPPQPSISGGNLVIREIKFESIKNNTPTYSISFGAVIQRPAEDAVIYARHGTPRYDDMRDYVHDFVFEKWHVNMSVDLQIPENVLKAITFVIPPCNFPKSKPVAFLSGLPPQIFGRKYFHTQFLQQHIHSLIKPLLPGNAAMHNYAYFNQAFGLQVRRNYKFTEHDQEEIYVVCVSNISDFELLSNILFPTPSNTMPLLPILNLPVSFIPIPVRPPSKGNTILTRHYQTLKAILASIRKKKALFDQLTFVTTHIFKDPSSPKSRHLILTNKNVITYAILHSIQKGINTRIYIKTKDAIDADVDDSVRNWFPPTDHTLLFFPRTSRASNYNTTTPSSALLQTVVKNLDSSLSKFAAAMGITELGNPSKSPKSYDIQTYHAGDPQAAAAFLKIPTDKPSIPIIPTLTNSDLNNVPAYVSPQTKLKTRTHFNIVPKIPLINATTSTTPRKRSLQQRSPSPTSSTASPSIQANLNPDLDYNISQSDTSPSPSSNSEATSGENNFASEKEEDEDDDSQNNETPTLPASDSIHVDGIMSTLRTSLPTDLRVYIEETDISERAYSVYEADDFQDALLLAKQELRKLANRKSDEYAKYKAKLKKKEKSSKKKKLKKSNPYLI